MGTASQRGMLGSAAGRLRTGAVPSTASREAAYGVALMQEVNIDNRPVTQQGMSGMRTSHGQGHGRLVQDGNFFMGVLRTKVNDIQKELTNLKSEADQHFKDQNQYSSLERTYDTLLSDIKALEGTLADYNLAMDKSRRTADTAEMSSYLQELEEKNRRDARELDNVFLMKQQRERGIAEVEQGMAQVHREMESKINAMDPQKLEEYRNLLQRSQQLDQEVNARLGEIDNMAARIREYQMALGSSTYRAEYKELDKKIVKLRRERESLQQDVDISGMDPKAARERLMTKVKLDQDRSKDLDRRMGDLATQMDRMRRRADELDSDMKSDRKGGVDASKVEVLQKRDMEMSAFIDKFEVTKQAALQAQMEAQSTIVGLLEHISSGLEAEHNIPDQLKMRELQDETSMKDKQLKSSEMTMKRLLAEKDKRTTEMAKIGTLEENIAPELEQLAQQTAAMNSEMSEFDDIEGLRARADATMTQLTALRSQYQQRREGMRAQAQALSLQCEALKKEAASNEVGRELEAQEQKLRTFETNIFSLREYVETKGREIDYKAMQSECLSMVSQLNEATKRLDYAEKF